VSACISQRGEYSDHTPDADYVCTRCGVLDELALVAELNRYQAETARLTAERDRLKDGNANLIRNAEILADEVIHASAELDKAKAERDWAVVEADHAIQTRGAAVGTGQIWEGAAKRAEAERDAALASLAAEQQRWAGAEADRSVLASRLDAEQQRTARMRETLQQHYVVEMLCDHERKMNKPWCACSLVDLGWHSSVGAAARVWIDHVFAAIDALDTAGGEA
jgi:hypothetical protein